MITPIAGLAAEVNASDMPSLARSYGSWSGIRTNHIVNHRGQFVGADGSSKSLSNNQDLELLLALRREAQILVVDAATARLENYKAPTGVLLLVLVSRNSNFEDIPAAKARVNNVFFASPKSTGPNWLATDLNPWEAILTFASNHSCHKVLAESGPNLTRLAFDAGLVHQSALTITPLQSDLTELKRFHPFDTNAQSLSVAQGRESTFTLWSH